MDIGHIVKTLAVVMLAMAIVNRVDALRSIVTPN